MRNQGGEDRPHRAAHNPRRHTRPGTAAEAAGNRQQVSRAPDAAFGGRDSDPAFRLERRPGLLQEFGLLGGGLAAENGVAVRKAAEARARESLANERAVPRNMLRGNWSSTTTSASEASGVACQRSHSPPAARSQVARKRRRISASKIS